MPHVFVYGFRSQHSHKAFCKRIKKSIASFAGLKISKKDVRVYIVPDAAVAQRDIIIEIKGFFPKIIERDIAYEVLVSVRSFLVRHEEEEPVIQVFVQGFSRAMLGFATNRPNTPDLRR